MKLVVQHVVPCSFDALLDLRVSHIRKFVFHSSFSFVVISSWVEAIQVHEVFGGFELFWFDEVFNFHVFGDNWIPEGVVDAGAVVGEGGVKILYLYYCRFWFS